MRYFNFNNVKISAFTGSSILFVNTDKKNFNMYTENQI